MTAGRPRIAVLGATGDLGSGLVRHLLKAGYEVFIGSRSADKAAQAAAAFSGRLPGAKVHGADNTAAAENADVVIMTVPFASHESTIESVKGQVQGKIFVDATVPLVPPKVMRVQLPPGGSAAKRAQQLLGENVRVVSAFQNIAAAHLRHDCLSEACDVLVCGNDASARETVVEIAEALGLKAWHAGSIDNSVVPEALTSILIFLNKKYQLEGAGIRIVGKRKA
jgi:hypothetical protein